MASALAGIMFLMPGVEISAADTEGGGTQTDVFQPSEYEVEWLLPDGIENGGIFTVTFHEAVRLEGSPQLLFQGHYRYQESLEQEKVNLVLSENPSESKWIISADLTNVSMHYDGGGDCASWYYGLIAEKSIVSVADPHKYNAEIKIINDVSGVEEIKDSSSNPETEVFNLQGERIAGQQTPPGLYIVKRGNDVKKVFLRNE